MIENFNQKLINKCFFNINFFNRKCNGQGDAITAITKVLKIKTVLLIHITRINLPRFTTLLK